jgi:hypothetical protein
LPPQKKQGKKIPELRKKRSPKKRKKQIINKINPYFDEGYPLYPPARKIINTFGIGIAF